MRYFSAFGLLLLVALVTGGWGFPTPRTVPAIMRIAPLRMIVGPKLESYALLQQKAIEGTGTSAKVTALDVVQRAQAVAQTAHVRPFWFVDLEPGDTVESLARRYGVSVSYLQEMNPGVDFATLPPESRLLLYRFDPAAPPRSVGTANQGYLVGGMPMPEGNLWTVRNARQSWGTPMTIRNLVAGFHHVEEQHPGGVATLIGDISLPEGGPLRPHKSHRTGRDVDAAYYSLDDSGTRFWDARSTQLDVARNWALFRYWIENDAVEYIFVDTSIQRALADYAHSIGEDPAFLRAAFQTEGGGRAVIRHARGHANHYHVRFRCRDNDTSCK